MKIKLNLLPLAIVCAFLFTFLFSCQKELVSPTIYPVIPTTIDSALLVKSIKSISINNQGGYSPKDSIIEFYTYDTVAHTITLTWDNVSSEIFGFATKAVAKYNAKGLLAGITTTYLPGTLPDAFNTQDINYAYDAENVLQNISGKKTDGSSFSTNFSKQLLSSSNYKLSWQDGIATDSLHLTLREALFNKDGKCIQNTNSFFTSGNSQFYPYITKDTITYDGNGSVLKVTVTDIDVRNNTTDTYVLHEYPTRLGNGGQLYNQRQALLNGIAEMPFADGDLDGDELGLLSRSLHNEERQYSKFPFATANAVYWGANGSTINEAITGENTIDSKGRLTKMKTFEQDDRIVYGKLEINYYK